MKPDKSNTSELILYQTEDGKTKLEVRLQDETVWLSQKQMAELFDCSIDNIALHLKNIYASGELEEKATAEDSSVVQKEGSRNVSRKKRLYNLDAIISVGYRVNSMRGTQFRIWATWRLKEYIVKGFIMDDDRLKNLGGGGYWKELLARIRDIRASEKVFYRQILDIYATSIDYDPKADASIEFFKKVQNKIHYAVHGQTAAEVIFNRVDAAKDFMGLMTFTGARPVLNEGAIAKNYLNEKELRALGQIVSGYLDFAERQAEREVPMKMTDWIKHLDSILASTGERILLDAGKVSRAQALEKVKTEYKKYQQRTLSNAEKDYLATIITVQKKVEKKTQIGKNNGLKILY